MNDRQKTLRACGALLLTAIIWGVAFSAQQKMSEHLDPFTCNALRFIVATMAMLPFMCRENKRHKTPVNKTDAGAGALVGAILFLAAFCQQAGVKEAGAGKAGFVTALYVVLVPLLGALLFRQKTRLSTWLALVIALPGLYLLCIPLGERFVIETCDLWLIIGAVMWAFHILCTDRFAHRTTALKLCVIQFAVSGVLNLICAVIFEDISLHSVYLALLPILYCGIFSNGVGYYLQTVGQMHAKPAHAALILSLESVFSVLGGVVLLGERMSVQGYIGCALMLLAVLLSQLGMLKQSGGDVHV